MTASSKWHLLSEDTTIRSKAWLKRSSQFSLYEAEFCSGKQS